MAKQTYRIRVTEYNDIEADSVKAALEQFHDELTKRLNGGNELDTHVTIVVNPNDKHSEEEEA